MASDKYAVGSECNSGNRAVSGEVHIEIDGEEIEIVPFVKNILRDTTLAIVKELDGYEVGSKVKITIG